MGRVCRGFCVDYVCQGVQNGEKYKFCKRCTYCGLFLKTSQIRCPCCKVILRTKPRSRKKVTNPKKFAFKSVKILAS